jgi:hypothetical protein
MKIQRRRKKKYNWKLISIVSVIVLAILLAIIIPILHKAPLDLTDLEFIMPNDHPSDYDVYRVVAVKPSTTRNDLVGLMQTFTRKYVNKDKVLIYIFNNRAGAYVGESKYLVGRYYQDKVKQDYERDIYMDEPSKPTN